LVASIFAATSIVGITLGIVLLNSDDGVPSRAGARLTGTASGVPTSTDWRAVLTGLENRRDQAYEQANPAIFGEVYVAGSRADTLDRGLMQEVVSRKVHASQLHTEILHVEVRSQDTKQVVLRVQEQTDGFKYLDPTGAVVAIKTAAPVQTTDIILLYTTAGWRIADRLATT